MLVINGVTGAIGQSVLELANRRSVKTCGIGRDEVKLRALEKQFPHSKFFAAQDVSDEQEAIRVIEKIYSEFGNFNTYLHAPALLKRTVSPIQTELIDFQDALRVNLEGTFVWNKNIVAKMIERKTTGVLLNMSSQAARTGGFGSNVAYAASKGGVESLTKSFARFGAPFGIRVNAISPGFVDNPMMSDGLSENQKVFFTNKTLLKRFARNDEIAKVCLFLLGEESSYITGEIIEVSAGQKIG
jgi:3-oxoacyl-[acyl-carrier protein] reductase